MGRCPRCGTGKLFAGFLALRPRCEHCGLEFSFADSADAPAFFVIFISGIIVGCSLGLWSGSIQGTAVSPARTWRR
jgi:uncharacterized protein (DUF983 family)